MAAHSARMSRPMVNKAIAALGLDPSKITEVRIKPGEVVVTQRSVPMEGLGLQIVTTSWVVE